MMLYDNGNFYIISLFLSCLEEPRPCYIKKFLQIEALCVIWASGQVNADITTIEKAIQASGSKVKMTTEDLKACVTEIQGVLVS